MMPFPPSLGVSWKPYRLLGFTAQNTYQCKYNLDVTKSKEAKLRSTVHFIPYILYLIRKAGTEIAKHSSNNKHYLFLILILMNTFYALRGNRFLKTTNYILTGRRMVILSILSTWRTADFHLEAKCKSSWIHRKPECLWSSAAIREIIFYKYILNWRYQRKKPTTQHQHKQEVVSISNRATKVEKRRKEKKSFKGKNPLAERQACYILHTRQYPPHVSTATF